MASILLVRHGQASFGKLNYDQLSDTGLMQGELVGKALAMRGFEASIVVHGSMQRHRQTFESAQRHWPSLGRVVEMAEFNEFDSDDVIACAFPQFRNKARLGAWLLTRKNKTQAFQELFAQAVQRWTSGEHDKDYKESWRHFCQRVTHGCQQLMTHHGGKNMVIFTSGGPITALAQHCLQLNNEQAFELNWTLLNASISQLLYSRHGRVSLAAFNEQQHLAQAGQHFLTYR
ncbi:histidine phosphatase family protein [Bacterioplanes sanyensis]|uniref:Histidine phosphatase family protein n=1 Tax=Bacterioplanes sanyensis TaxID=1249553 RepID=A0A222FH48_9GAMM|nr:histidine phosphatase family protein [Bacterioplanes sanyensis]ASP38080.1 histidine phosphatase family protein [Bacterioplanes sanyensis]